MQHEDIIHAVNEVRDGRQVSEMQRIAKEGLQEQGAQPVLAHAVSHLVQPDG